MCSNHLPNINIEIIIGNGQKGLRILFQCLKYIVITGLRRGISNKSMRIIMIHTSITVRHYLFVFK